MMKTPGPVDSDIAALLAQRVCVAGHTYVLNGQQL